MYKTIRSFLFLFDAESIHHFSMHTLQWWCRFDWVKNFLQQKFERFCNNNPVEVFGLPFKNPVGLAAGFDKNAKYLEALETLGFGHIEIGTVTPLPQSGNDKPRLFRLPIDKALINRMGFNNEGADAVADRLKKFKESGHRLIIGGNIGKNKVTPNEEAWKDYEICFKKLNDVVDYFVVNVSSPNTPGLRDLQQVDSLQKILKHLHSVRAEMKSSKPILLKISPDLNDQDLINIVGLSLEINLDGLVVSNTTISRSGLLSKAQKVEKIKNGGLSGKPLFERSTEVLKSVTEQTNGKIPVIASGGIFSSDDARKKLNAGASLVQVYTGFIYEGPGIVKEICKGLRKEKRSSKI